jgi:hypothetical protein
VSEQRNGGRPFARIFFSNASTENRRDAVGLEKIFGRAGRCQPLMMLNSAVDTPMPSVRTARTEKEGWRPS